MMSQIVMSMSTRRSCSGNSTRTSFFETRVQIVDLSVRCVVIRCPRPGTATHSRDVYLTLLARFSRVNSRDDGDAVLVEDHRPETLEDGLDLLPRLRRGIEERSLERARGLLDLLVPVEDHDLVFQVDLVDRVHDRDLADDVEDALDPIVQLLQCRVARQVAHCEDPFRTVEERLLQEVPEAFLAHDVPDGHVHLELRALVREVERHLPLRDLRAEGRDVPVVELVLDEPPDEGGLSDRRFAHEANLRLDPLDLGHRGTRVDSHWVT